MPSSDSQKYEYYGNERMFCDDDDTLIEN